MNIRASTQELYENLHACGQNAFPHVNRDFGAINNVLSRFLAAGFYYKTFMGLPPFEWGKGTSLWMFYEKFIRKAAGMGRASREADPDIYDHAHSFCDVMVVGGGVAGLRSALEMEVAGLDVILVEQDWELGGVSLADASKHHEIKILIKKIEESSVRIMKRSVAFGLYDGGVAGVIEQVNNYRASYENFMPLERFWTIRTKAIVLATGALERHAAFNNNDRPGIMCNQGAHVYLNRYAILLGQHIVIATNNDSVYASAFDYATAGAKVTICDARAHSDVKYVQQFEHANIEVLYEVAPYDTEGYRYCKKVKIARYDYGKWKQYSVMKCDKLLYSYGFSPVVHLLSHRSFKPIWSKEKACFIAPDTINEPIFMAGSSRATWDYESCLHDGELAAANVLKLFGKKINPAVLAMKDAHANKEKMQPIYEIEVQGEKGKKFVDPLHDVTADDIKLAHQEGYVSVEHLKRYTTLGMAPDQGKMGNIIGLAMMANCLNKDVSEVGTTTFRPPYTPISLGALKGRFVGEHFRPLRRTPLHDWNIRHGAVLTEAGLWRRPWYYPHKQETLEKAYIREATTVRKTVGVCDVTSLGKIAIQGPDAALFLDRVYSNMFSTLKIGKARYGIMLRDDGFVMDDGTTWRLAENEFFMTTTTTHAAKVMTWLEELHQTRWSDLKIHITSLTDQWAGIAIAGPKSRDVLQKIIADPDEVSNDRLPFMGVLMSHLKENISCRIARISFSGERAYEVYVGSDYAEYLMDLVHDVLLQYEGCMYGLEALGALRIEKGHVTGAELDGRVTIEDAGLGNMASKKKSYIGSVLKNRQELCREDRAQLVGIFPVNKEETF